MYRPLVVNSLAFNFLLGGPGGVLRQREDDVVPQGLPDSSNSGPASAVVTQSTPRKCVALMRSPSFKDG